MPTHHRSNSTSTYTATPLALAEAKTLPLATVQKIINEVLASPASPQHPGGSTTTADAAGGNMTFAKETRDLLIECCVEFITMLSSEANEIAEKEAKKTIACEHITKALEELGFGDYVPELVKVADGFKSSQVVCLCSGLLLSLFRLLAPGGGGCDVCLVCVCVCADKLVFEQTREKKQSKIEQSGMTNDELIRAQEELFRSAGEKYNTVPSPGEG